MAARTVSWMDESSHEASTLPRRRANVENALPADGDSACTFAVVARTKRPWTLPLLALLSAAFVLAYHGVLIRMDGNIAASTGVRKLEAHQRRSLKRSAASQRMDRIAAVTKEAWPECVTTGLTAVQCKEFIDAEILRDFTGQDKLIRTIIRGKRSTEDAWYNAVVILMNDNDIVEGRDGDGQVYYDFEWQSSGVEATPEQQADIPPVIATETEAGSPLSQPLGDPDVTPTASPEYLPEANPEEEVYEPLILEDQPILVEGATVEGAILEIDTNPIAGGVVVDADTPNETPEADATLDAALQASTALAEEGTVEIASEGARSLPTFDCTGMTGYNCCLMIKVLVADADIYGNGIQCHLQFVEESAKWGYMQNSRGKKVNIFANHLERVSKVPVIVGSWPAGQNNITEWLENA